jgi:hypothetical protein
MIVVTMKRYGVPSATESYRGLGRRRQALKQAAEKWRQVQRILQRI